MCIILESDYSNRFRYLALGGRGALGVFPHTAIFLLRFHKQLSVFPSFSCLFCDVSAPKANWTYYSNGHGHLVGRSVTESRVLKLSGGIT